MTELLTPAEIAAVTAEIEKIGQERHSLQRQLADALARENAEQRRTTEAEAERDRLREALANIIKTRDTYGWSPEVDAAIVAARNPR